MFGVEFETAKGGKEYVWQNSFGLSTRTIGVMVMVHGDDKARISTEGCFRILGSLGSVSGFS